jgi:hypothetical protein
MKSPTLQTRGWGFYQRPVQGKAPGGKAKSCEVYQDLSQHKHSWMHILIARIRVSLFSKGREDLQNGWAALLNQEWSCEFYKATLYIHPESS